MKHSCKYNRHLEYLINGDVPISINVVGAGGSGTELMRHLARINWGLRNLDHAGFHVTLWDDSDVREPNIGRQDFTDLDVGLNKANVCVQKINRSYGFAWDSVAEKYDNQTTANIVITCVDKMDARLEIAKMFSFRDATEYPSPLTQIVWLDLGNSKDYGQCVLGGLGNPTVFEKYPNYQNHEDINEPSCSFLNSIESQDLFINSTIALDAANLLWDLFYRNLNAHNYGAFSNINHGTKSILAYEEN